MESSSIHESAQVILSLRAPVVLLDYSYLEVWPCMVSAGAVGCSLVFTTLPPECEALQMEIGVKERSEDSSPFFAGGGLARANDALAKFFPGERFRFFLESLGLPEKYTRVADWYFDVSLAPTVGMGRRPQLPPPLKCNMHP